MTSKKIAKDSKDKKLDLVVIRGKVLGVNVYRGFARLSDLSSISRADIFDQEKNPLGTQRDLSQKHAREAYDYVMNQEVAFWPEIFLSIRDRSVMRFKMVNQSRKMGNITIDLKKVKDNNAIAISRVDGNHRLHFADGHDAKYPSIHKTVSFCLAYDLSLDQEIKLFRDINNNQRRMNTSHLDNIQVRMSDVERFKQENTALYIAKKLGEDKKSTLYGRVWEGGAGRTISMIPLRTLHQGITYLLSQPSKVTMLKDADAQYIVIRNYFTAVKQWQPQAWTTPKDYFVLRGAGLWAICFIGSTVIDRALGSAKYKVADMLKILTSGRTWDWSRQGDFKGYSGRSGSVQIRDMVTGEFSDEGEISIKNLARKILDG